MRILITGGAGFIGSHLAAACVAAGHEVGVLDNLCTGQRHHVPSAVTFFLGDLTCRSKVAHCLEEYRAEAVIHLAAQMDVRHSVQDPAYDAQVNILGGLNLLSEAQRTGVRRFIFASSGGALYGQATQLPTPEGAPVRPLSPYGISKAAFEQYLRVFHEVHGLPYVILRYANVYGPRQNAEGEAGVVTIFAHRVRKGLPCTLFGENSATRDYVYVEDVVRANLLALTRGTGEVLNIGTGRETTVREVFEAVGAALGSRSSLEQRPARAGEVLRSSLDSRRAQATLGWVPQVSFAEGVRRTVASLAESPHPTKGLSPLLATAAHSTGLE